MVAVSVLLARKIIELVRAFRAQVPGSRLTARTVAIFGSLVIAPLIIVYLFSLEFLNRGIDSWFKVEIKQGLTDALELSKSAMDVRMREYARSTELFANRLADSPPSNWALATDAQRVESGALEIVVYGTLGQRARGEQRRRDRDQSAAVRHAGDDALRLLVEIPTGAWSRCRKATT